MEPQCGVSYMQESRAMKNARSKNRTQETKLVQTIQALDKHIKSRSGQLMNEACDTRDLISSINAASATADTTQGQIPYSGRAHHKTRKLSMTLVEFDRRMQEKRDRMRRLTTNTAKSPMLTTRDKGRTYQSVYSILPAVACESDMALYKKKQSMRDALDRANSHDIKYTHIPLK